jgi:EmrB/QacA subfamily drug resistance transporter
VTEQRKRLVLITCILGTAVVAVDATVVNVALPAIRDDVGGGFAGQQWVVNAYLITLASLILVGGSLGDLFGERRVFAAGVAGFGIASILAAAAPTIEVLVFARALQGVAGAAVTPAGLAVIVAVFPPDERGKAIGSWTAWGAIGMVIGPLLGGWLVDVASWRWVFAINVPVIIATLVLIQRVVPQARETPEDARVDSLGGLLCVFGLAGITFGLIRQPEAGWADPSVFGPLASGALLFAGFVAYEARSSHPMLPLELFRSHNFALGNLETLLMYAGLAVFGFFQVIFLQEAAGWTAVEAGLASLPITGLMFTTSSRFGALADRFGPRFFMGVGPLVAAAGLALQVRVPTDLNYWIDMFPSVAIFSIGLAMTVAPLTATVLSGADEHNAGTASGVNNAIARVAGLLGVSAVGAVVAATYGGEAGANAGSYHLAMGVAAGLVAIAGVIGVLGIQNPKRKVDACDCGGGQLAGAPKEAARHPARSGASATPRVRSGTAEAPRQAAR